MNTQHSGACSSGTVESVLPPTDRSRDRDRVTCSRVASTGLVVLGVAILGRVVPNHLVRDETVQQRSTATSHRFSRRRASSRAPPLASPSTSSRQRFITSLSVTDRCRPGEPLVDLICGLRRLARRSPSAVHATSSAPTRWFSPWRRPGRRPRSPVDRRRSLVGARSAPGDTRVLIRCRPACGAAARRASRGVSVTATESSTVRS